MIFSREHFVRGEVEGALVVEVKDYSGNIVETRSYTGNLKGRFVLTLAWDGGRSSKEYGDFATAMRMANGHWARQAIWEVTPSNSRKRVVRWQ